MAELLALGISHKTAPVALRERVAMTEGRVASILRDLTASDQIEEAVALSTCNRTELYLVVDDVVEAESLCLGALARQASLPPTELAGRLYALRSAEVPSHLFRVASGLESVVIGEAEIQGQVRRAYELALVDGASGPILNHLFRAALTAGGRVRAETAIGQRGVSVPSVAVEMAERNLGDLEGSRVVLVGAGETAELVARNLTARGAETAYVANRHRDRAEKLAAAHGGEAISLEEMPSRLLEADLVITATLSPHHVVEPSQLEPILAARSDRPLVLIDLAVPRDVHPGCRDLAGVTVLDIDDLQAVVERNESGRLGEADTAERILDEELDRFQRWVETLRVVPTVAALKRKADRVVADLLAENEGRWQGMTESDRARLDSLAGAVAKRLLHEPISRLKEMGESEGEMGAATLRDLFGLDQESDDSDRAAGEPEGRGVVSDMGAHRRAKRSRGSGEAGSARRD